MIDIEVATSLVNFKCFSTKFEAKLRQNPQF